MVIPVRRYGPRPRHASSYGESGTSSAPTLTHGLTIVPGSLVVIALNRNNSGDAITIPAGFTELHQRDGAESSRWVICYKIETNAPATYSFSWSTSTSYEAKLHVFTEVDLYDPVGDISTKDGTGVDTTPDFYAAQSWPNSIGFAWWQTDSSTGSLTGDGHWTIGINGANTRVAATVLNLVGYRGSAFTLTSSSKIADTAVFSINGRRRILYLPTAAAAAETTGVIPIRRPWTRQPPQRVNAFDQSNPLGRSALVAWVPGWESFSATSGAESGQVTPVVARGNDRAALTMTAQQTGSAVLGKATRSYPRLGSARVANYSSITSTDEAFFARGTGHLGPTFPDLRNLCVAAIVQADNWDNGDIRVFSKDDGTGTTNHDLMIGETGGNPRCRIRFSIDGVFTIVEPSFTLPTGRPVMIVGGATYTGTLFVGKIAALDSNGAYDDNVSTGTTGVYDPRTSTGMAIGASGISLANGFEGDIIAVVCFDHFLSEAEMRRFMANPWQIFQPLTLYIPAGAAAAPPAGVTHINWIQRLSKGVGAHESQELGGLLQ